MDGTPPAIAALFVDDDTEIVSKSVINGHENGPPDDL
jgi:hypothetical protein